MIFNGNCEAISVLVVPLEHIASVLQKMNDTLGVSILHSNQKWRHLWMRYQYLMRLELLLQL